MTRGSRYIVVLMLAAVAVATVPGISAAGIGTLYRTEDWRTEKHVPVIDLYQPFRNQMHLPQHRGSPHPVDPPVLPAG